MLTYGFRQGNTGPVKTDLRVWWDNKQLSKYKKTNYNRSLQIYIKETLFFVAKHYFLNPQVMFYVINVLSTIFCTIVCSCKKTLVSPDTVSREKNNTSYRRLDL